IRQWKMLSTWLEKEARASHEWQRLRDDADQGQILSGRRLTNALAFRDEIKPTAAWAERYGGGRDRIEAVILAKQRRKRLKGFVLVITALVLMVAYTAYQQDVGRQQNALIATQSFRIAVSSAQKLLDQVSVSLDHGDMNIKSARDMLRVASGIVEQVD